IVNVAKLHRSSARKKAYAFLVEGVYSVDASVSTGAATDIFVTERAAEKFAVIVTAAGYMVVFVHPITHTAAKSLSDNQSTIGLFSVFMSVLWSASMILNR